MAKVTAETVTPAHVKAARAFLDWTAADLAKNSGIGAATVRRWESGNSIRSESVEAIFDSLKEMGIVFQNGGEPGVRLMKPAKNRKLI